MLIAEKIKYHSFPTAQFLISNFHQPFRLHISRYSAGLLVFVRSNHLTIGSHLILKLYHLKFKKWLFVSACKPPPFNNQYLWDHLSEFLDFYSSIYNNKVAFDYLNLETSHTVMLTLMNDENFINLLKENISFKGKKSFVDLILTNRIYSFNYTFSTEKGLNDHHRDHNRDFFLI